jgi:hypothetical protein
MAIPRKRALQRLQGFASCVEEHLAKLAANRRHPAVSHRQQEVRHWLREMEEMLSHVGKKTAAEWRTQIQAYRETLES